MQWWHGVMVGVSKRLLLLAVSESCCRRLCLVAHSGSSRSRGNEVLWEVPAGLTLVLLQLLLVVVPLLPQEQQGAVAGRGRWRWRRRWGWGWSWGRVRGQRGGWRACEPVSEVEGTLGCEMGVARMRRNGSSRR